MGSILKINTVYSNLQTDDDWLLDKLWKAFRFRDPKCFHSAAYRMRRWDGFRDYFLRDSGRFLTGLLPEVTFALKSLGIEYTVVDKREPFNFLRTTIDEDFLWSRDNPIVLRDYQIDLVNAALRHKRGIIHSPTGSGKTFCMLSILTCLPPKTMALIIVDTKELVLQNFTELKKFGFNDAGMWYSDTKDQNYITVALINSVPKLDKEYLSSVSCCLVDEVHTGVAPRNIRLYRQLPNANVRIGFSATPYTFGGKDQIQKFNVKGHIGPILTASSVEGGKLTTAVMQQKHILSPVKCIFYVVNQPKRPFDIYGDAVKYCIAQNEYLNQAVARLVKNKLKGRTLLSVERIEHGERLVGLIDGAFWLYGSQKKEVRAEAVDGLKYNTEDFVAVAISKIVNKGINVFVHNICNLSGFKAAHLIIQFLGRGLRTTDDKETLNYYDFYFTNNPYLEKHSEERVKVLKNEGHEVEIREQFDF